MLNFKLFFVFIFCFNVFSCDAHPLVIEEEVSICDIHTKTKALEKLYSPAQVAHIVDKDGTLTNTSTPIPGKPSEPRGHADLVLKRIIERGSPVVVSSAWNNFSETVKGLSDLGLAEALHFSESRLQQCVVSGCGNPSYREERLSSLRSRALLTQSFGSSEDYLEKCAKKALAEEIGCVKVTKLGNVVSCQEFTQGHTTVKGPLASTVTFKGKTYTSKDYYSRAKWRALEFIEAAPVQPKVVCMWEDSAGNLAQFKANMHLASWYPTVEKVYLWHLSEPMGAIYDEDIVPEFQCRRPMIANRLEYYPSFLFSRE